MEVEQVEVESGKVGEPVSGNGENGQIADSQAESANGQAPATKPDPALPVKRKNPGWPRNLHTPQQIDEALTLYQGDRKLAAKSLGLSAESLKRRMHYIDWLRIKWGKSGMMTRTRLAGDDTPGSPAKYIKEAVATLSVNSTRILQQVRRVEERLEKGMSAQFSEDPEDRKYRFKFTAAGHPAEEKMYWEVYLDLAEEYRRTVECFAETNWKLAKTGAMGRRFKGGPESRGARPGFAPKMQRPTTFIKGDQVVVQQTL